MADKNHPLKCANCFYLLDQTMVVANGASYCCAGCAQGGPCTCSYGHPPPDQRRTPETLANPSGAFTRMVENMAREVEITRQVIHEEAGTVNDLLALLQKATRLMQAMARRLDGQQGPPPSLPDARSLPEIEVQEACERITLVVENATDPDIAFSYTRALGKLDSVRDIKLANINRTNLLYHVETTSKTRFAREVMSLPDYRPVRVQATLDEITVLLHQQPIDADGLERLLASAMGEDEDPGQRHDGPGAASEPPDQAS